MVRKRLSLYGWLSCARTCYEDKKSARWSHTPQLELKRSGEHLWCCVNEGFSSTTVTDVLLEYDMLPSLKLRLLNYPLLLILELPKVNMHVVASCGSSTQLCMSDKYTYYVPELMKSSLLSTHHIWMIQTNYLKLH